MITWNSTGEGCAQKNGLFLLEKKLMNAHLSIKFKIKRLKQISIYCFKWFYPIIFDYRNYYPANHLRCLCCSSSSQRARTANPLYRWEHRGHAARKGWSTVSKLVTVQLTQPLCLCGRQDPKMVPKTPTPRRYTLSSPSLRVLGEPEISVLRWGV